MAIDKSNTRKKTLRRLRLAMFKDRADPEKLGKWFKLMESKKKIFALEDEINKLTKQLKSRSAGK
ncbi:MAG: hypothetical protein ABH843_03900 [Candidatus Omnitrophota bacterium]